MSDPIPCLHETADYRVRALPPEEWTRHRDELPENLPDPEFAFLIVVEEKATGTVVASWFAITTTFLEGLKIAEAHRHQQDQVQMLLLGGMLAMLDALKIAHPLTLAQDPAILRLARKAGFVEVPGTLLMLE